MPKKLYLVGREFGRLTVIADGPWYVRPSGKRSSTSLCRCSCGTELVVANSNLLSDATTSCGCWCSEVTIQKNLRHGHHRRGHTTRTYRAWLNMIQRCTNPNNPDFHNYGGRGIADCDEWRNSFYHFLSDMGECPDGLEIDRWPNKDGNYEINNCRWTSQHAQARNTRRNVMLTVRGQTGCLKDLCVAFNVPRARTEYRLRVGWDVEAAFFDPPRW